jgi:hypothetical protein
LVTGLDLGGDLVPDRGEGSWAIRDTIGDSINVFYCLPRPGVVFLNRVSAVRVGPRVPATTAFPCGGFIFAPGWRTNLPRAASSRMYSRP